MRERTVPTVEDIELVGGRLCLDFANTANWLDGAPIDERLNTYSDLVGWGRRQGLIDRTTEARLNEQARCDAAASEEALVSAVRLRDANWRIFSRTGDATDIAQLNAALALPGPRLSERSAGAVWVPPVGDLGAWLLHPVAASAAELLTSPVRPRVKSCPGDRCGWVFLDGSPSGRRRWCSMATCGNRRKARAHYSRRRAGER